VLIPLVVAILVFGFFPGPFLAVIEPAVTTTLDHVATEGER
jgi:NADH-quinone oxidoreductase subunit M